MSRPDGPPQQPSPNAPVLWFTVELRRTLAELRGAIDRHEKLQFHYSRADGEDSQRTVAPLGLFFWGRTWTLAAWCELRVAYRSFRVDRIHTLTHTGAHFGDEADAPTLQAFLSRDA